MTCSHHAMFVCLPDARSSIGEGAMLCDTIPMYTIHVSKFRVNYGTIGLMDWIRGMDVVGCNTHKKLTEASGKGALIVVEDENLVKFL